MFDYTKLEGSIEEKRGRAKHIVDTALSEKREMTESERREYDSLYGEITATRQMVDQLKDEELDNLRSAIEREHSERKPDTPTMTQTLRSMEKGADKGLVIEHRDWTTASGASATIMQEWHAQVLSIAFEQSISRKIMQSFTTQTTHNVPYLSGYGASAASIVSEMTAYTEDDPTIANVVFGAYKLAKKVDVSEELLKDSGYDLAGQLAKAAGIAFGRGYDRYMIGASGTGTSTPSGLLSASATTSGAGASGITVEELIAFQYTLPRHYRDGACLVMNDDMVGHIAALRTTVSATEGFFWNDPVAGEPAKLWGMPIYTSSYVPSKVTASAKTICLFNPNYWMIGDRGPMNVKRMQLNEYSDTFAVNVRFDGHPLTSSATRWFTTSTT